MERSRYFGSLGSTPTMKPPPSTTHDCEASAQHFSRMEKVARHLANRAMAIRGYEYYPHFFGMWKIEAGSFDRRFQFLWDGREQTLTISEGVFEEFGKIVGDWKLVFEEVIDARHGADPFSHVEHFFD